MIHTGLVSVTFRNLNAEQIISLVVNAGLEGIEWGGDIHVPHGNLQCASKVWAMTREAGLRVAAYGSYYRAGCENTEVGSFEHVLDTAVFLGAPTIRVWAGDRGSEDADSSWWNQVVEDSRHIASLSERKGITISFESHSGTLTDTTECSLKLLDECRHGNIRSLWQPPVNQNQANNLESIRAISPWLSNLHVFYWQSREKYALQEGESDWMKYLQAVSMLPGERYALLEFVRNEQPEQFLQDAQILKKMIRLIS